MGQTITTRCCIAGGGPAGMMLGLLLARAGIDVVVLEKHADFLRDFRGDTIHPSTLELMHELGLLDALLALPRQKLVQQAQLVHDLQGRRVHRVTAKIAQEVGMLFQHQHLDAGARQQQALHHPRRAAARDAAARVQNLRHG